MHGLVIGPVYRVSIPYTELDKPGAMERHTGVEESTPGVVIRGRVGSGVNGEAVALA